MNNRMFSNNTVIRFSANIKLKSILIKAICIVLSCILVCSMCSIQAFASNAEKAKAASPDTEINQNNNQESSLKKLYPYEPKINNWFIDELFNDFGIWGGCPASVRWWTRNFLADALTGKFDPDATPEVSPEMKIIEEIREKQYAILDEVKNLSESLKTQEYKKILEEFELSKGFLYLNQGAESLKVINDWYKDYYDGTKEMTDEIKNEIKNEKRSALVKGLGISDIGNPTSDFDKAVEKMGSLILTNYKISDGQTGPLFYIKQLDMRQQTTWEHEAWESLENYYSCTSATFLSLAMLEVASLNARIEMVHEKEENDTDLSTISGLESTLENIKIMVDKVRESYAQYNFNKDANYRHFWANGQDIYFQANIQKYTIPQEKFLKGQAERTCQGYDFDSCSLFKGSYCGEGTDIRDGQWNSFQPGKNGEQAITTSDLNAILKKSNYEKSLSSILRSGKFEGFEGDYSLDSANQKKPTLILNYKDDTNKFFTNYAHSEDGGEATWEWKPSARGVGLDQKKAIGVAPAVESYLYKSFSLSLPIGGRTEISVKDIHNDKQVYYSLIEIPKSELVNIQTKPRNGAAEGYIAPDSHMLLKKGSTVKSLGNKLVFFDNAGKVVARQSAQAGSNRYFVGWKSSDPKMQKGFNIDGTINSDTSFSAVYEKGLQANVSMHNDSFITDDEPIDFSYAGVPMVGAIEIQYKVDGNNFGLRFKTKDSEKYKESIFKPQSEYTKIDWMISGVNEVIKDSDWHNIDSNGDGENLKILGNTKWLQKKVHFHFLTNDEGLGGFYAGPGDGIPEDNLDIDTLNGVIELNLSKSDAGWYNQNLNIQWIDAVTKERKSMNIRTKKNSPLAHLEKWVDEKNEVTLDVQNQKSHKYYLSADDDENIEFKTIWK